MGAPLPTFLRFLRFARTMALAANIWTIFCAVLIVGWQIIIFFREGSWHALPISFFFSTPEHSRGEIYSTASIDPTNLVDAVLEIPAILPLLLAVALLTAYYLWLSNTEGRFSGN